MPDKELISLEEHNERAGEAWAKATDLSPRSTRIACPECGDELIDPSPGFTLASLPPKKHVVCRGCGWKGTAVV